MKLSTDCLPSLSLSLSLSRVTSFNLSDGSISILHHITSTPSTASLPKTETRMSQLPCYLALSPAHEWLFYVEISPEFRTPIHPISLTHPCLSLRSGFRPNCVGRVPTATVFGCYLTWWFRCVSLLCKFCSAPVVKIPVLLSHHSSTFTPYCYCLIQLHTTHTKNLSVCKLCTLIRCDL